MTEIRISGTTSTDEVRRQLSGFGRFSHVDASIENDGNVIVLHEVTLGQRFARLFQSAQQRSDSIASSRCAMRTLADTHPAIEALLGRSINHKSGWAAKELHQALAARLERLVTTGSGKEVVVPLAEKGQVGVADAKVADIAADNKVIWNQAAVVELLPPLIPPVPQVRVTHPASPTTEQMRAAYAAALNVAAGHVVIAPIKSFDEGVVQSCSDTSIVLLLEAIDEAKKTNPNLTAVTIAAREYDDRDLAGRIEDLQALRKSILDDNPIRAERGRFYPPNGRQVPDDRGIHFLANSPFDLQADRIIVPRSVAESNGYEYVSEGMVSTLPKRDKGRLIALDDNRRNPVEGGKPEKILERFTKLLESVEGSVVISPPSGSREQLMAMMTAVLKACESNDKLSVSFATSDRDQQAQLTDAYRSAIEDRRPLDIDKDDDDLETPPSDLWKTV